MNKIFLQKKFLLLIPAMVCTALVKPSAFAESGSRTLQTQTNQGANVLHDIGPLPRGSRRSYRAAQIDQESHDPVREHRLEERAAKIKARQDWRTGASMNIVENVQYVPGSNHPRQQLDLFLPKTGKKPFPLVVFIHGGAWRMGNRHTRLVIPLTHRGFAVATVSYRLTEDATWPAQIYDCKAAVRWLRAHATQYGIDSKRVGVWGESAGGHLAALLGTSVGVKTLEGNLGNPGQSSAVQAVVDWFGPTDLVHLVEQQDHLPPIIAKPDASIKKYVDWLFGGTVNQHMQEAKDGSPLLHVTSKSAPILIIHGDRDPTVPVQQTLSFYDALKRNHVDARLHVIHGGVHGTMNLGPEPKQEAFAFLEEKLMKGATTRSTTR